MSREREQGKTPNSAEGIPLVSVIIPAYNAEAYIAEAVDSALNQNYPNKEVIIIDDGSTDNTVDVLEGYGDRIRLIRQANSGSAVARNAGLDAAAGTYIAFLDGDDIWLPGKLNVQVAYMERHPDIGMTQGRWLEWQQAADGSFPRPTDILSSELDNSEGPPAPIPELSGWVYHLLLLDCVVWTSAVMARRELIERVGRFDEHYVRGQDYQYWLRASRHTCIHKLNRVLALYRKHDDNSTRGFPVRNYAVEIIDEAVANWGLTGPDGSRTNPNELRKRRARLWFGYARKQLYAGRARQAIGSFKRAGLISPFLPRVWLMLMASVLAACGVIRIADRGRDRGT